VGCSRPTEVADSVALGAAIERFIVDDSVDSEHVDNGDRESVDSIDDGVDDSIDNER